MIAKQDRQGVRKASDLEQKYDLGQQDLSAIERVAISAQQTASAARRIADNAVDIAESANSQYEAMSSAVNANAEGIADLDKRVEELENGGGGGSGGGGGTVDAYTKEESLSSEVKSLLGLEDSATPSDAFQYQAEEIADIDARVDVLESGGGGGEIPIQDTEPGGNWWLDTSEESPAINTGMTMKLLWENPNPTSSFAAQTITMDLSMYDSFLVVAHTSSSLAGCVYTFVYEKTDKDYYLLFTGAGGVAQRRAIRILDSYVTFAKCQQYSMSNGSESEANDKIIPYRIYGIKGVTK